MKLKFVIWGVGLRGRELAANMHCDEVVAFIDSDLDKIGMYFMEKPIISIEDFLYSYKDCYIIISMKDSHEAVLYLESQNIYRYFILGNCPPELRWRASGISWHEIPLPLDKIEKYAIYGLELYSLLLYNELMNLGYVNGYLIPHATANKRLIECIREDFPSYRLELDENIIKQLSINKFFATVPAEQRQGIKSKKIIEAYDLSDLVPWYHNERIKKFRNMHVGKRCFIIGSGPSLRMDDLQLLYEKCEFTIGSNNIFAAFDETDWRPTYYVVADPMMFRYYSQEIIGVQAEAKFFGDLYPLFWEEHIFPSNIYKYHVHRLSGFSDDFSKGSYNDSTVTMDCIQLASYMGFQDIYLLGVDFDYTSSRNRITAYFSEKCKEKLERIGILTGKNVEKNFTRESSLRAYKLAKDFAERQNISIYNSTRGGKLEIFERVDFDSLFQGT